MAVIEIVGGVILLVVRVWLVSSTAALTAQTTPV